MGSEESCMQGRYSGSELLAVLRQHGTMSDWKYDLDDVGPEAEPEEPDVPPIEKGNPSLENVVFVLLGALAALYVFATLVGFG